MEHILNLEQVKKYYGGNSGNITKAVDGISMYVDKGEFVAIMGASGSGKTTLLNCISTIDTVTSGHITVNNQDITKIKDKDFADFRRENLGFIFQDFNLLDTLTIEENISLSLVINKQNSADIEKRVHAIEGLSAMLSCGRATARKIGEQAGAKIVIGRRVLYSIEKVKKYLLYLEE